MQQLNSAGILLHNLTGEAILIKGCTAQPDEYFVVTELVGQNLQANYGELLPEIELEPDALKYLPVFTSYTKETLNLALEGVENGKEEQIDEPDAVTGQSKEDQVDSQEADAEITLGDIPPLELPPLDNDAPKAESDTDLLGTEDHTPNVFGVTVVTHESMPEDVVALTNGTEVVTAKIIATEEVTEPEKVTPDAPRRGRPPKNNS